MSIEVSTDKHTRILKAAEQIMLTEGMNQLSMNKVAQLAKVAKGTLYLYFDSKEAIIGELTIKSRHMLRQRFQDAIEQHPNEPIAQLRAMCWACLAFYEEEELYPDLVSFYEANTGLQETAELLESSIQISYLVIDVIQKGQQEGVISQDQKAASLSFIMWGSTVGMMHLFTSKSHHVEQFTAQTPKDVYHTYVELFLDSITTK